MQGGAGSRPAATIAAVEAATGTIGRWLPNPADRPAPAPARFVTLAAMDNALWGLLDPAVLRRIVVVSPHFDDAALGAAHLLATYPGSTVITVLAGRPPAVSERGSWEFILKGN